MWCHPLPNPGFLQCFRDHIRWTRWCCRRLVVLAKSVINGQFFMAMLNNQRVHDYTQKWTAPKTIKRNAGIVHLKSEHRSYEELDKVSSCAGTVSQSWWISQPRINMFPSCSRFITMRTPMESTLLINPSWYQIKDVEIETSNYWQIEVLERSFGRLKAALWGTRT